MQSFSRVYIIMKNRRARGNNIGNAKPYMKVTKHTLSIAEYLKCIK